MRATFTVAVVLSASLVLVGTLRAQPKQSKPPDLTPKAPANASQFTEINGKTLSQWVKEIKDPDPSLAEMAIRTVVLFGSDVAQKEAAPALIDALSFTDTSLRVNAAIALTLLGVDDSHLTKALNALRFRVTSDQQAIVRFHAAVTLGRLEDDARPAIAELVSAARDQTSWEIRRAALYALGKAGRASKTVPPDMRAAKAIMDAFAGTYPDRSAQVRLTAVQALGGLGIPLANQDKVAIVQAFNRGINDRYKPVAIWAHVGLIADGEPVAGHLTAILKYLNGTDFEAHLQGLRAIGLMGTKATVAIPALIAELRGKEPREPLLMIAAAWALGEMGDAADKAVSALEELKDKKDTDETVKKTAADALDKIAGKKPKK